MDTPEELILNEDTLKLYCVEVTKLRSYIKHGLDYFKKIVDDIQTNGHTVRNKEEFYNNFQIAKEKIQQVRDSQKAKQRLYNQTHRERKNGTYIQDFVFSLENNEAQTSEDFEFACDTSRVQLQLEKVSELEEKLKKLKEEQVLKLKEVAKRIEHLKKREEEFKDLQIKQKKLIVKQNEVEKLERDYKQAIHQTKANTQMFLDHCQQVLLQFYKTAENRDEIVQTIVDALANYSPNNSLSKQLQRNKNIRPIK